MSLASLPGRQQAEHSIQLFSFFFLFFSDKSRSLSEGRRVPAAVAVENPTAEEIGMVCKFLKLEHVVEETKRHPSDFFNVGRVRVQIEGADGKPVNPDVPSKKVLLLKLAEFIPQLKSRTQPASAKPTAAAAKKSGKNTTKKKTPTTGGGKKKR